MNDLQGSAEFSVEDPPLFRWRLDRWWAEGPRALVCMANPSYAGGDKNDPTVTQLIKLIRALGYPGFTVVNWSPFIATDPSALHAWRWNDPTAYKDSTQQNLANIERWTRGAAARFVAWGNIPPHTKAVVESLSAGGDYELYAFARTKSGNPVHPMARGKNRLKIGAAPIVWQAALEKWNNAD